MRSVPRLGIAKVIIFTNSSNKVEEEARVTTYRRLRKEEAFNR